MLGFLLLPEPWGFFFAGSFGTWIILVMNMACSWVLWNVEDKVAHIALQYELVGTMSES